MPSCAARALPAAAHELKMSETNKKVIALFVAVLLTVSFGAKVSAVSAAPSEEQRLENAVARIKYDIPDADVTVADGIIHIVLDDPEKIPGYSTPEPGLETNTTPARRI